MSRFSRRCTSFSRFALLGVLLAATAVLPAAALDLEPYLFAGYRHGDLSFPTGIACIELVGNDCPISASNEDGGDTAWGLGAAARIHGPWWFDFRWSRQDSELRYFGFLDEEVPFPATSLEISQLHAGVLYRFLEGRWTPFVGAFGGVTHLEADSATVRRRKIDLDRASAGIGGGLMVDLGSHLGMRFELRGTWTDLPADFDGDLEQLEASAGVRLRF